MTHYLKFSDEAEAIASLQQFRFEDQWLTYKDGANLDVIGAISKLVGEEVVTVDGFHVNYLGDLPEALSAYEQFPVTPFRVFA